MDDTVALLQRLGFGDYEARAYLALLRQNPLNGYELAKASGLPRANVYAVLQKLEERGAVIRLDTPAGTRYAPVPPEELIQRLRTHLQDTLDAAQQSLNKVSSLPDEYEYVWNTRGYGVLIQHARALLDSTRESLLLAVWPDEALALVENVTRARKRGVEVTTLCLSGCPNECGNCRGRVFRYRLAPDQNARWLILVPDGIEVLAGEIGPGDQALAVRTRQRLLVELTAWYIRHSIALAAVLNDLGGRLQELLGPETRSALASLGPRGPQGDGGWLEYMRQLLSRPGAGQPPERAADEVERKQASKRKLKGMVSIPKKRGR